MFLGGPCAGARSCSGRCRRVVSRVTTIWTPEIEIASAATADKHCASHPASAMQDGRAESLHCYSAPRPTASPAGLPNRRRIRMSDSILLAQTPKYKKCLARERARRQLTALCRARAALKAKYLRGREAAAASTAPSRASRSRHPYAAARRAPARARARAPRARRPRTARALAGAAPPGGAEPPRSCSCAALASCEDGGVTLVFVGCGFLFAGVA